MNLAIALLGAGSALFSTAILLLVSLVTGMGPWIAPTLVILAGVIVRIVYPEPLVQRHALVIIQAIGSIGGAVATAVGFCLPALYFLRPALFSEWIASPGMFVFVLGFFAAVAGWWGVLLARIFAPSLLSEPDLTFPVSTAIVDTIDSQHHAASAPLLLHGAASAWAIGLIKQISFSGVSYAPVGAALSGIMPVGISVGFLAGIKIVIPLCVGMVSRWGIIVPLTHLFSGSCLLAFCSGMIVSQVVESWLYLFARSKKSDLWALLQTSLMPLWKSASCSGHKKSFYEQVCQLEGGVVSVLVMAVLYYFSFSVIACLLLIPLSVVLIKHLVWFACRTGLGPYGRYMTYAMVPLVLLAGVTHVQAIIGALFVGISGAVAVDAVCSYRVAQQTGVSAQRIHHAHIFGVLLTSCCIGILFLLVCSYVHLGSEQLIAHKGYARALLLGSLHMQWAGVACGAVYAVILRRCGINPTLVFGGIVMPAGLVASCALGAVVREKTNHFQKYTPFWSGVFTGDAVWILLKIFMI